MKTILCLLIVLLPLWSMAQTDYPQTRPDALPFTTICQGGTVDFNATVIDDGRRNGRYKAYLLKTGENTVLLAENVGKYTGTVTTRTAGLHSATNRINVQFTLPRPLTAGGSYFLQLFSMDYGYTYPGSSTLFSIKPATTLTISGNPTIVAGSPASINLTFTGTPPFSVDYNDYSVAYATNNPIFLQTATFSGYTGTITPRMRTLEKTTNYSNFFVQGLRDNSGCAVEPKDKSMLGQAVVSATPMELRTLVERSSVCAGATLGVQYTTINSSIQVTYLFVPVIQLSDASGSFANPTTLATGAVGQPTTNVTIPPGTAAGTYRVRIISNELVNNEVISPNPATLTITKADRPNVTTPASLCQGGASVTLQASGSGTLNWYDSFGYRLSGAPTQSTNNVGTFGYKVSQTINGCESDRADVSVTVKAKSSAPTTSQNLTFCQNQSADVLSANGSNLIWYDGARNSLGSNAPRPSTSSAGQQKFFVSRDESGCRSDLTEITVNVSATPAAPGVSNPATVCQYKDAPTLSANAPVLRWYRQETGGNAEGSIKPGSDQAGTTSFWVSQIVNGCESARAKLEQTISPASPDPTTTTLPLCRSQSAPTLTAGGQNLRWYEGNNTFIGTNAPTPPTDQTRDITYKVSQTSNGCESKLVALLVQVRETPGPPGVSDINVCNNDPAPTLTAQGDNKTWYTTETGGNGAGNPPGLSTAQPGDQTFWVSQRFGSCEGPRAKLTVRVLALPQAPGVSSPAAVCQYRDVPTLVASGPVLRWYRQETGGNAEGSIKPGSDQAGTTPFWVSQVVNGCEGGRAKLEQTISPASPDPTTATLLLCRDQPVPTLTAGGQNLRWYDNNSNFISTTAPKPLANQVSDVTYKVSQNSNGCESKLAALLVQVRDTPGAPGVSPVSICQNQPVQSLTATGSGLVWYEQATGGTPTTLLTPQTATLGERTYWVAQKIGTCEGPRAALVTTVYSVPAAPLATDRAFCLGDTPTSLTASGQNLRWYEGNSPAKTSIAPPTSIGQSLTYVVTQTQNGCESAGKTVSVRILSRATVRISGDSVSLLYDSTAVRLRFAGDPPWRVRLWDGQTVTTSTSPLIKWEKPTQPGTANFAVQAIENDCGAGQILNTYRLLVLAPLALEPSPTGQATLLRAYPIPASQQITLEWQAPDQAEVTLQLVTSGGQVCWRGERRGTGHPQTERFDLTPLPAELLTLSLLQKNFPPKMIKLLKQ